MEPFGIGMAGIGVASVASAGAFALAFRKRRRQLARRPRSLPDRLEALAAAQAELGLRLDALAQGPEEKLQAMAGQLVGLIRDKNAAFDTAVAGLDQLRARMRALEQMGEPAEARALVERLEARLEALQGEGAARAAALEARIQALEAPAGLDLAERLAKLYEARDAGAAALARLAPLEARLETLAVEHGAARTELAALKPGAKALADELAKLRARTEALAELPGRLAALEGANPEAAIGKLAERLEALRAAQGAAEAALGERIAALGDAVPELATRLAGLERGLAEPRALLDRFAERLEAVQGRVAAIETAENPFAEISEQLTRLYGQKDAAVETVFARLQPLEAKLAELEQELAEPRALLDRFAERLEAVQGRVAVLETAENPFAEISEQLTRLYGQKDAAVETVFARLQPLEAKLAELEQGMTRRDPRAALDRFAERLEAVQGRVAALETAENPFAEISEQLTRLYGQKDAAVETVFARLQPLEAKLAEIERGMTERDPRAALDRFAERLEAVQGRVAVLETAENPFAEISEQLTRLYGQKDAAVETVFARLQPLEAKLAEIERGMTERDPRAALDRFAERLEAVQGRVAAIETAENPFAEISAQLTRLYGQKDAAVETVLARLQPLEAKLAGLEQELTEPRALLDRFAERLEAVQGRVAVLETAENPFAEISAQLTRLYGQKDAAVETVFARLAPLEAKLAGLEQELARLAPLAEDDSRAAVDGLRARLEALHWAQGEVAAGLAALRADDRSAPLEARLAAVEARPDAELAQLAAGIAAAGQTAALADRLARLEARLGAIGAVAADTEPRPPTAAEIEAIWTLPRIVSLHRK
jgi:chromosome segregation ATPase